MSEGFDKCEVIPDHQGPTKLKLVFCWDYEIFSLLHVCFIIRWPVAIVLKWRFALLLQFGWSLDWHRLVSLLSNILSSIQFCDTSNVSDLMLQYASSHVDFQALQFYAINNEFYFALSTFQVSGKQISLTKLMVSSDLPRSTVTNQIAFDQRDVHSTP